MTVTTVLGEVFQKAPLAVTGEDGQRRLLAGMAALLGGLGIVATRRRRRRQV